MVSLGRYNTIYVQTFIQEDYGIILEPWLDRKTGNLEREKESLIQSKRLYVAGEYHLPSLLYRYRQKPTIQGDHSADTLEGKDYWTFSTV